MKFAGVRRYAAVRGWNAVAVPRKTCFCSVGSESIQDDVIARVEHKA